MALQPLLCRPCVNFIRMYSIAKTCWRKAPMLASCGCLLLTYVQYPDLESFRSLAAVTSETNYSYSYTSSAGYMFILSVIWCRIAYSTPPSFIWLLGKVDKLVVAYILQFCRVLQQIRSDTGGLWRILKLLLLVN